MPKSKANELALFAQYLNSNGQLNAITMSIDGLTDVDTTTTTPTNGQTLVWDGNNFVPGAGGGSSISNTNEITEGTDNSVGESSLGAADGTNNLFYTDARVDARIALQVGSSLDLSGKSTSDLSEGTNLYYTDARADARIAAATSDDVSEGSTNLYYTDARARAAISESSTQLSYNNLTGVLTFTQDDTDGITEGSTNLYYTNARADARIAAANLADLNNVASTAPTNGQALVYSVSNTRWEPGTISGYTTSDFNTDFATKSTSDLSEGTNLYYTDARVDTHLNQSNPTSGYVLSWNGSDYAWVDNAGYSNSDVDSHLNQSNPTAGYVLSWNGSDYAWIDNTGYTSFNTDFDTRLATKDTGDLSEGTNLYYTNARADARITAILQDDDTFSSPSATNIASSESIKAYVDAQVASKDALSELSGTTDDVTEGSTNLYYTDARAQAVSINEVVEDTSPQLGGDLDSNGNNIKMQDNNKIYFGTDDDVSIEYDPNTFRINAGSWNAQYQAGNHYFRNNTGSVNALIIDPAGAITMKYNNSTKIVTTNTGVDVTGNITTTGYIAGPATFTIDPAAVGDNTGTVVIAGNLQVDGTTTTVNSTTLDVDDLNITVASGAANAAAANGAGLTVDGASATLLYVNPGDKWAFNKPLDMGANNITTTGNFVGNLTGQASDISNHDTGDLSEGTNLYYTDARADARVAAATGANLSLANKTTTDLAEGTNLYYTSTRANTDFDTRLATKSTTDVAEGSNLYYTDARAQAVSINEVVEDTTPQLGGNLDVGSYSIVSASGGNIAITPDTTGSVVIDGLSHPQADGTAGQILETDGAGTLSFTDQEGAKGGGTDHAFIETDNTINSNYTISTNRNAMTVGPVTIGASATVTVPSGQRWVIL